MISFIIIVNSYSAVYFTTTYPDIFKNKNGTNLKVWILLHNI